MQDTKRQEVYIAIDLKSFYASVECVERSLDPMTTNLVVADADRTEKTICLAVSPSLKAYGISGRARLFEVVQKVREINIHRQAAAPQHRFAGSSYSDIALKVHPEYELDYIIAMPRMALYMEYSTRIYQVYLKYLAPEDIHVYSIDEIMARVTDYLNAYHLTAKELTAQIIREIYETTGITATAGVGTNLYLCKVAMDILAKHVSPDKDGVRIAELDEMSYRRLLWTHTPITDFWRVGNGYARRLAAHGMYTMGDVARCSIGDDMEYLNENLLYKLFGVNAELLIDHAWGWEPCTMEQIKAFKPQTNSLGSGQVLQCPYDFEKAKLITREMTDALVLDLVDKHLVTDQMVLTIGYDRENLTDPERQKAYKGPVHTDHYGRQVPKHAQGTVNLKRPTSSTKQIMEAVMQLYDRITDPNLLVRRINIVANHIVDEDSVRTENEYEQMDLFTDYSAREREREEERESREKERKMQQAMLEIKKKFGKNAVLKGTNLEEGATMQERNAQIGGHKA